MNNQRENLEEGREFEIFSVAHRMASSSLHPTVKSAIKQRVKPKPIKDYQNEAISNELKEMNPDETILWIGRSSQIIHWQAYTLCFCLFFLAIPLLIAWILHEQTKNTIYVVTRERLHVYSGIFGKKIESLELYRVKDTMFIRPFMYRFFRLGNIRIITSDANLNDWNIEGIEDGMGLREKIRRLAENARVKKGVTEIDYYSRGSTPLSS